MKRFLLILGATFCVILIVAAMYVALTIGESVYLARENRVQAMRQATASDQTLSPDPSPPSKSQDQEPPLSQQSQAMKDEIARTRDLAARFHAKQQQQQVQQREGEMAQMQHQIASMGNNMTPDAGISEHDAAEVAGKLPSLFSDPEGYETEDNWLASGIGHEVATMAAFALHPKAVLPDIRAKATVDGSKPLIHVELLGLTAGTVTSDLSPAFAWDPDGYAPVARQLLGTALTPAPELPVTKENDVLAHLLDLTGAKLAEEDVRLSANLQANPASWQDHEAASLLLTALALRSGQSSYADNRSLLNRATAHLALAQVLRGNQSASWPGLVADAAVRTLAGREVDALAHLDALSARPDVPDAAKSWLMALRVLAKGDWREAKVTPDSPLLVKIVWFQVLHNDLVNDVPAEHLREVVPPPPPDPTSAPDAQPKNPQMLIPDWGQIAGRSPFYTEAGNAVKNAEYKLASEIRELDEILKTEKAPGVELAHLAGVFSDPEADTVSRGADGKMIVRVIGPGGFKDAALAHLFSDLIIDDPRSDAGQDSAELQTFFAQQDDLFQGVPGYELARLRLGFVSSQDTQKQYADWEAAKKTWPLWGSGFALASTMPGYGMVKKFYGNAVPFGTAFEVAQRFDFIRAKDPQTFPPFDSPELEKLKQLPTNEALPLIHDYMKRYNEKLRQGEPKNPTPFEASLLKLDPDLYELATDHVPSDQLMSVAARFVDYNMMPIERIESLDAAHLSDADRLTILRKHVVLEPAFGFRAGVVLRSKGLVDEAAEMDRKAFATGNDPVGISNSVLPLVDYDLAHGLNDEALKVAKAAGDTMSEEGLSTYSYALERLGRLDEAADVVQKDGEMYSDPEKLTIFELRHPDRFLSVYHEELSRNFPNGLLATKLADFSGPPADGVAITSDSDTLRAAGLQQGDVMVALGGYRTESEAQYIFVRALSLDAQMDFIVWRAGQYLEIKATVPGRRMMVDLKDYQPGA